MLLQEPAESPYDIRFQVFGIPVRVSWSFWIGALIFGMSMVNILDTTPLGYGDINPRPESLGRLPLLVLWALCLLLSILIHELGHALAFRQSGIRASIVLYHFGGLAIPTSTYSPGRSLGRLSEKEDLWIAVAGPLAQIASAVLLIGAVRASGYEVLTFKFLPIAGLDRIPGLREGNPIDSPGLFAIVVFYTWPSVVWALLNLVPVWPLDGGRIMRSLVLLGGGNTEQTIWISLIAAGSMAAYGFSQRLTFMGILFLSLAITNYQMLQQSRHGHY